MSPLRLERLTVGSTNAGKLAAVGEALADPVIAGLLSAPAPVGFAAESGVSANPVGFEETMTGARNRARAARAAAGSVGWGVGVESGSVRLMPDMPTLFHFDVCCVFDGTRDHFGVSSGFEYPARLCEAVFVRGEDFQAARQYIDRSPDLSQRGGVIGILSAGVTDRIATARQAARLAFVRAVDPTGSY